jgi:hypothetical protein
MEKNPYIQGQNTGLPHEIKTLNGKTKTNRKW